VHGVSVDVVRTVFCPQPVCQYIRLPVGHRGANGEAEDDAAEDGNPQTACLEHLVGSQAEPEDGFIMRQAVVMSYPCAVGQQEVGLIVRRITHVSCVLERGDDVGIGLFGEEGVEAQHGAALFMGDFPHPCRRRDLRESLRFSRLLYR
jgi:hypothetical protein